MERAWEEEMREGARMRREVDGANIAETDTHQYVFNNTISHE